MRKRYMSESISKIVLGVVFLLNLCAVVHGTIYYVDNTLVSDCLSGNYSIINRDGSGSDGNAYNTAQKAADISEPGDLIYFREGTYYNHSQTAAKFPVLWILRSGTENAPITYKNYPDEVVILSGENINGFENKYNAIRLGDPPSSQQDISGTGVQNITIEGLIVEGASVYGIGIYGPANKYASVENPTENIAISRVILRNNHSSLNEKGGGIGSLGKLVNVIIEYCEAYNNTSTGIYLGRMGKLWHNSEPEDDMSAPQYCVIQNCLVYNNTHPLHPGNTDGIGVSHSYNCVIKNNVVYGNSDDGIDCYASIAATIKSNIVFNQSYEDGNNTGIKFAAGGGGRHLVVGNVAFNNDGPTYECSRPSNILLPYYPDIVCNNIALNGGGYGISVGSGYTTAPGFEKLVLRNNISLNNEGQDVQGANSEWTDSDFNFIGNQANLTYLRNNGQDEHSLTGNPKLNNQDPNISVDFDNSMGIEQKLEFIRSQVRAAFSLTVDSLLIDAGVVVDGYHNPSPGNNSGDLEAWFGGAPDIGAYEHMLTGPYLCVDSPNGGETWRKGETRAITWTANEVTGNLVIELVQNDTVAGTIATGVAATAGSFSWTVGKLADDTFVTGSNLKIRIRTVDGQSQAEVRLK